MGLNVLSYQSHLMQPCHPADGHEGSSHLSLVLSPCDFLSRCKSALLQFFDQTVEFYLLYSLTFSRCPLRKSQNKNHFFDNNIVELTTSACMYWVCEVTTRPLER